MQQEKQYFVYILASKKHGTIYIGVTSDLLRRVWQHKESVVEGFTKKYGVNRLVYYEVFSHPNDAIQREKSLKRWPREWKANLIERDNPDWSDIYASWEKAQTRPKGGYGSSCWKRVFDTTGQARG